MIDLPKFLRVEAQRAELFAELIKRIDSINGIEAVEAAGQARLADLAKTEAATKDRLAQAETAIAEAQREAV
jgi:septal ring factor EnvC (AmiA/AmiB activator)